MSLAREALRLCTVRALRDKTLAGERVRDSEQGPVEDFAEEAAAPEILVYTDEGAFGDGQRNLYAGGVNDLVVEVVMTQRMKVRVEDTGEDGWVYDMPQTDAAMELAIGTMSRQVINALMHPTEPWAEMWKRFALQIGECKDRRGSSMRDGVRFAGRQLTFPVTLPRDPAPGEPLSPLWTDFFALVDATPDLAPIAPLLRSLAAGDAVDWPDWRVLQGGYGMTLAEARAMRLTPPEAAEETSPTIQEAGSVSEPTAPGGE